MWGERPNVIVTRDHTKWNKCIIKFATKEKRTGKATAVTATIQEATIYNRKAGDDEAEGGALQDTVNQHRTDHKHITNTNSC